MVEFSLQKVFLGMLLCMVFTSPAFAKGKVETLTKANVKNFIERTSHMTTSGTASVPLKKIKKYLDKHIEDRARFKTVMQFNMPGLPPQEQKISLTKEDFISNVEKGGESIQDYEHLIEIDSIKISSDQKKAFVKKS